MIRTRALLFSLPYDPTLLQALAAKAIDCIVAMDRGTGEDAVRGL